MVVFYQNMTQLIRPWLRKSKEEGTKCIADVSFTVSLNKSIRFVYLLIIIITLRWTKQRLKLEFDGPFHVDVLNENVTFVLPAHFFTDSSDAV